MKKFWKISSILMVALIFASVFTGCEEDEVVPDEIIPVLPSASFTSSATDIIQYDEVTFTNTSENAVSYLWTFGVQTSTDENPVYRFIITGDIVVTLTATDADGLVDVSEQTITVAAPHNYSTINGSISYVDSEGDHVDGYVYDGSEMVIDSAYWKSATQIYLFATDSKFDGVPLALKFTPNLGLGNLDQTYTYEASAATAATYDFGISGGYAGMSSAWTVDGWGVAPSPYTPVATPHVSATVTLVYELETGEKIYDIVIENILINAGDFGAGYAYFLESTNSSSISIHYRGTFAPFTE